MSDAAPLDPPPPTLLVWIGFIAMTLGNFMALLDIQIVASSIGAIQAGVSASRDEISWVQTGYLIAEVIGIPLSGFLARAFGARLLFCLSATLFTLASLMCSLAWDLPSLVVFRAIQGFVGAPMIPLTMAATYIVMPRSHQLMAGALMGMVVTTASSLGPTIGGFISGALGWRALFWINLFPGVIVAITVWLTMRQLAGPQFALLKKIDFIGLLGMALMLGAAEYTLEEGPGNGWFESPDVAFWALVSAVGAAVFFWRALRAENPIVDLRPFRFLPFVVGAAMAFLIGLILFSGVFLTPLFLSSVRGYSSLQIGHTMIVQGATMFVTGPLVGWLARSLRDLRWLSVVGVLLVGAGCLTQTLLTSQSAFWELALPQMLRGVGLMISFTSVMMPALQSLPPDLIHSGTALFNTIRNLGGAFGIAGLATVQAHAFALHRQELYAAADPANPHVAAMIAGAQAHLEETGAIDPPRQALMHYAGLLDREALVMTFNDQFLLLGLLTIAASGVLFIMRVRDGGPVNASPRQVEAH